MIIFTPSWGWVIAANALLGINQWLAADLSGSTKYSEGCLGRLTFAQDQREPEALVTRIGRKVCFRGGTS